MYRSKVLSSRGIKRRSGGDWLIAIISGILTILVALLIILTAVPVISPSAGADLADLLRAVVGPGPVAVLESASFRLQDRFNQVRYQVSGDRAQIQFSDQSQPRVESTPSPSVQPVVNIQNTPVPAGAPLTQATPVPDMNVVSGSPQIGWQAYGPDVDGSPAMARALVMLDPQRSYASIALVRIDLSKLHFHIMPGSQEPGHPSQITRTIPDPGMVPPADQAHLIAAFNGGFKRVHGHFGMMAAGITIVPPLPGLGTVALYRDGRVQIGTWGADLGMQPDLVAFRQNCPPLIQAGMLNPALTIDNRDAWGYTNNSDITWRTGLGITQDGRYLIYAVGNGTSVATLAEGLQQAGAYAAMQLDINQVYAHFFTYQPSDDSISPRPFQLTTIRLLDEMTYNPHLYLTPFARDFFYLTSQ